jgi:tRNA threonylcarbamoyladenosine modification (KEOPS) complex Cgi121 subunit
MFNYGTGQHEKADLWWGARAIIDRNKDEVSLGLLCDRQSWSPNDPTHPWIDTMRDFLKTSFIPYANSYSNEFLKDMWCFQLTQDRANRNWWCPLDGKSYATTILYSDISGYCYLGCCILPEENAPEEQKSQTEIKKLKEREDNERDRKRSLEMQLEHMRWLAKMRPIERAKNKAIRKAAKERNKAELVPVEEATKVGHRFKIHINQGERDSFVRVIDGNTRLCQYYMPKGKCVMFTLENEIHKQVSPSMLKRKKYKGMRDAFKANSPDGYADWVEWHKIDEEKL